MSALSLPLNNPALRLNWPRIGALSGAMSLHLSLALLLLMPPVAMQLIQRVREEHMTVVVVDPPPKKVEVVEPVLPQPRQKDAPPPRVVQHHEAVTHVDTPVTTTEDNPMSYPATTDTGLQDIGPAKEIAPSALGYGATTTVKYPLEALRRREHGTVILRVLVGADGTPQQIDIETSSGSPRLDSAARDAVRRWTFRPGTRNGIAQSAWARVPIAFDLTQL